MKAAAALLLLVVPVATARSAVPVATGITVTTISDASNGDIATVSGLLANPGADGISLREAIQATNSDPGTHTIRFSATLAGTTITLDGILPHLAGGGVTPRTPNACRTI